MTEPPRGSWPGSGLSQSEYPHKRLHARAWRLEGSRRSSPPPPSPPCKRLPSPPQGPRKLGWRHGGRSPPPLAPLTDRSPWSTVLTRSRRFWYLASATRQWQMKKQATHGLLFPPTAFAAGVTLTQPRPLTP